MIIGFVGGMGSGKSLSMVKYAYSYYKEGYRVLSNINLKFRHEAYELQDLIELTSNEKDLRRSVVILDEAHIFLDSRNSVSRRNKIISYFLLQTRKKGCHLFYTTQRFHQVDKRLRDNTDIIIRCQTKEYKGEKYTFNEVLTFTERGVNRKKFLYESSKYYNLYDTYEVVRSV